MLPSTSPILLSRRSSALVALFTSILSFLPLSFTLSVPLRGRSILGIDWSPAPAPEDGPPLSRNASRDPSLLPAQIGGILGAYVLCLLIISLALLFVGRRLRASAQGSRSTLDVEMVKPVIPTNFDPSPVSPDSKKGTSWPSPDGRTPPPPFTSSAKSGSPPNFSWPSPKKETFQVFDERVLEKDKVRREQDMERLYAMVMQQDAAKSANADRDPGKMSTQHARQRSGSADGHPAPKLHSPSKLLHSPRTATFAPPSGAAKHAEAVPLPASPRSWTNRQSRASSIISNLSAKSKRRGVRGLPISSPIPTPTHSFHSRAPSDEEPLTPYMPPPPPPPPPAALPSPTQQPLPVKSQPASIDASLAAFAHQHRSMNNLSASTARSTPRPLPFRTAHPEANTIPKSTRVTVLEQNLANQGKTPRTANGTALPYSPYMPFTPITPITPRLLSRRERKEMQKAEGREVVKELAKAEGELWDSGY